MDGTIVNTETVWDTAGHQLIERRGITCTPELKIELKHKIGGLALQKSCAVIKELVGLSEPVEDLIEEKRAIALDLYGNGIGFVDGFEDFYRKLDTFALKKAIATNADDPTIRKTNDALDLRRFFGRHIYGISAVNFVCKPDPAVYIHAANKLGVQPTDCIAVEDSAFGIAAARAAGMTCIGINTGNDRTQLAQAHRIVDTYHEIDLADMIG